MSKMSRQQANLEILSYMADTINRYPHLRFGQVLSTLGLDSMEVVDFYIESDVVLKRVELAMEKLNGKC